MKLPSFQFYPGDWQKDPNLRRCSHTAKGVLMDAICLAFELSERGVFISDGRPWTEKDLAVAVGGNLDVSLRSVGELLDKSVLKRREDGSIFIHRLVKDEETRKKRAEGGKLGGNPILIAGKVNLPPNLTSNLGDNLLTEDEDEDEEGSLFLPEKGCGEKPRLTLEAPEPELSKDEFAEEIYQLYPRKVAAIDAKAAIRSAMKTASPLMLREKTAAYAKVVEELVPNKADRSFVPHPATWFNKGRYLDDPAEWRVDLTKNHNRYKPQPKKPDYSKGF